MIKDLIESYSRSLERFQEADAAWQKADVVRRNAHDEKVRAQAQLAKAMEHDVAIVHGDYVYKRSGDGVERFKSVSSDEVERVGFLGAKK